MGSEGGVSSVLHFEFGDTRTGKAGRFDHWPSTGYVMIYSLYIAQVSVSWGADPAMLCDCTSDGLDLCQQTCNVLIGLYMHPKDLHTFEGTTEAYMKLLSITFPEGMWIHRANTSYSKLNSGIALTCVILRPTCGV